MSPSVNALSRINSEWKDYKKWLCQILFIEWTLFIDFSKFGAIIVDWKEVGLYEWPKRKVKAAFNQQATMIRYERPARHAPFILSY